MSLQAKADLYAERFGVDPELFRALVQQESGWNPGAVNAGSGAFGLTQAMPATAQDPGFGVAPLKSRNDPDEQLRFGAEYLAEMLERYDGDKSKALAAYNWGPGNADDWNGDMSALPQETRDYIAKITGGGSSTTPMFPDSPQQADAQYPVDPQAPLVPEEPEYADNALGRLKQGLDTRRDNFRSQLGLSDRSSEMMGGMLQQLGLQMMAG